MDDQRQDDQLELDVALKALGEQWMIETGGKRGSGRSMLAAQHDDYIYILH